MGQALPWTALEQLTLPHCNALFFERILQTTNRLLILFAAIWSLFPERAIPRALHLILNLSTFDEFVKNSDVVKPVIS